MEHEAAAKRLGELGKEGNRMTTEEETIELKEKQLETENPSSCCGTQSDLQPFPMLQSAPNPCCGDTPENAIAQPSPSSKASSFWVWGLSGIGVLFFLFLGTGLFPGLQAKVFWKEVLSNLSFVGKAVWSILPFFLISVGISAWVTVSGFAERIKAIFERKEVIAIAGASVIGATIPICSCGVIPLIAALLASGVPLGPVMAFWISSPLMSPEMFLLTGGVLGIHYAVARLLAAIFIAAGAGYIIYFMSRRGKLKDQFHGLSLAAGGCCESDGSQNEIIEQSFSVWRKFFQEALTVSLFLGKWLLIAFILEAVIVHYLDPAWISSLLGKEQVFAIPLATAIGIPLYTSGVAAIPIVEGLLKSGMGHGAALAFLVAGPVTTIPAMTAVFALVRRQTFAVYLGAGIIGSLFVGYAFQIIMG